MTDERDPLALPEIVKKSATEVRQSWSESVNEAASGEQQIVIEKNGTPIAALISAADLKLYRRLVAQRRERFRALYASWEAFRDVPQEELEAEIDRAVAEVRAERKAVRSA